jgi:hypothetical protein
MKQTHEGFEERKLCLVEALLGIKEETLLIQIERVMLDVDITSFGEIRTLADLEISLDDLRKQIAEAEAEAKTGQGSTTEELLEEIEGW